MALHDAYHLSEDASPSAARIPLSVASCDDRRAFLERFRAALRGFFDGMTDRRELRPNPRVKENRRGPVSLTSPYRGVTQHKKTRKWESHIWKRGKQLYCGAFGSAPDAAQAHDILALHLKGAKAVTNFMPSCYVALLPFLQKLTQDEIVESLRRCANGDADAATKKLGRTRMARATRQVGNGLTQYGSDSGAKAETLGPNQWKIQSMPRCTEQRALQTPLNTQQTSFFPWNPIVQNPLPNDVFTTFTPSWEHDRSFYSSASSCWLNDQALLGSWSRDHCLPILQGHVIQVHGHPPERSVVVPESGFSNKPLLPDSPKKPKSEEDDIIYGTGSNGSQSDPEIQAAVRSISFANDYEAQFHQFSSSAATDIDNFSPLL